jgi:hypothetical protein
MLSLRQVGGALWAFISFMIAAAVVMNLRYKPLDGDALLLDTWTGDIRAVATAPVAEIAEVSEDSEVSVEIAVLESIVHGHAEKLTCNGVGFAFPAPQRIEVRAHRVMPERDFR